MYEPKKIKLYTTKECHNLLEVEQWIGTLHSITAGQNVTIEEVDNAGVNYYATFNVPIRDLRFWGRFIKELCGFDLVHEEGEEV